MNFLVKESKMFKVLTLNVAQLKFPIGKSSRTARILMLCDILVKDPQYDIICLQELFRNKSRDIAVRWLSEKYPYFIVDKSRGRYLIGVNSGLAIFSKHPITRDTLHRFTTFRGVENFTKKGVLGVEIDVEGSAIYIFTTHLQTGLGSEPCICKLFDRNKLTSNKLKTIQLDEITAVIEKFAEDSTNVILTGDMNIRADSDLYDIAYEKFSSIGLLDTFFSESEVQNTVIGKDRRIDYIWFSGTGDSIIIDFNPKITDHNGVVGDLYPTRILNVV